MAIRSRDIRPTAGKRDAALARPEPPADLWAALDRALAEVIDKPAGAFTRGDFMRRYGCTASQAGSRIAKLVSAGCVEAHGHGASTFYTFVNSKEGK